MKVFAPPLAAAVRAWIAGDPDPGSRRELEELLASAENGDRGAADELADRFSDRLHFGTAGLRGVVAAGPNRMNRAVVRTATAALARWLDEREPGAREAGVVLGCDARHGSSAFLEEAAGVLAGAGYRVHLLEQERPTPLLAFSVPHLKAAAGVMITASHNPRDDNGYKLYLGDGAQIVPPVDGEIEALMASVGPLSEVPIGDVSGPLVTRPGKAVENAYLEALLAVSRSLGAGGSPEPGAIPAGSSGRPLRIVYTPLHGVAGGLMLEALERAGYDPPLVVPQQAAPDGDFPTVSFPNPEEPGALDLALELARHTSADVVIASDPDGDRFAAAVPDDRKEGGWRRLRGDEIGAVLGELVLRRTAGDPSPDERVVATTIVSSSLLSKLAASAGAGYAETLPGFKWVARAAEGRPGGRLVFGYEEALGYSVGGVVRDKDGIGAALSFLAAVDDTRSRRTDVPGVLDAIETAHGVHLTAQSTIRSHSPGATVERLRSERPTAIAGRPVVGAWDLLESSGDPGGLYVRLPPANVLVYRTVGGRVIVRPSGTEPKLKVYFEVIVPLAERSPAGLGAARATASGELGALKDGMAQILSS